MKCPGQDSRYWKPGAIFEAKCPRCGQDVEFFKDDPTRKCRNCGHIFVNPKMDFGCASYCKYADQCLQNLPPELMAQRDDLLKNRVALETKRYLENDFKSIDHATRVARFAEQIVRAEGGDPAVVLPAAYLHDIGKKEAEKKHQSREARYQELEGPTVAGEILSKIGARREIIDEVCDIIGHHHHPRNSETINFKCLYDGDLLVDLEDRKKKGSVDEDAARTIDERFLTETGKLLAREVLL